MTARVDRPHFKSGRKPSRFCPHGHDKFLPGGSYIVMNHGHATVVCAICQKAAVYRWRKKRRGFDPTPHLQKRFDWFACYYDRFPAMVEACAGTWFPIGFRLYHSFMREPELAPWLTPTQCQTIADRVHLSEARYYALGY